MRFCLFFLSLSLSLLFGQSSFPPPAGGGGGGSGTVTEVDTTTPITGGPLTAMGTIACATCVTGTPTNHGVALGSATQANGYTAAGATNTLLHGATGADPTYSAVVSADMNITTTACTNQAVTAISAGGVGTCTTLTSAYVNNSIALTGTDINTSNQVTATHLAAALPIVQGGTGATTLAGAGILVSGGALGTPASGVMTNMTGLALAGTPLTTRGDILVANSTPALGRLALGAANTVLHGSATDPAYSAVVNGDLSGLIGLAHGGVNLDLTATGGTSQVLKQTSSGGAITVARLACADLSDSSAACSSLTSLTLVTPTIGVATATSVNKMAITAPATSSTLAVADGKTFTASNTLTLAGTDSTTMTFPATSATIARTDAANTFTGVQTMTSPALTTSTITTSETLSNNNIGVVSTDGYVLQNTTPALVGAQQRSPRLHFIGQGWKTASTAGTRQTEWIIDNLPVQASANPANTLIFAPITNGTTGLGITLCGTNSGTSNPVLLLDNNGGAFCGDGTSGSHNATGFGPVNSGNMFGAFTNGTERVLFGNNGMLLNSTGSLFWTSGSLGNTITGDTGLCRGAAGQININDGTTTCTNYRDISLRHTVAAGTAPTISSGGGGTGAAIAGADEAGAVTVGTSIATGSIVVALGTAYTNAPPCFAEDTTNSATIVTVCVATTTQLTLTSYSRTTGIAGNFTASDVVRFSVPKGY